MAESKRLAKQTIKKNIFCHLIIIRIFREKKKTCFHFAAREVVDFLGQCNSIYHVKSIYRFEFFFLRLRAAVESPKHWKKNIYKAVQRMIILLNFNDEQLYTVSYVISPLLHTHGA